MILAALSAICISTDDASAISSLSHDTRDRGFFEISVGNKRLKDIEAWHSSGHRNFNSEEGVHYGKSISAVAFDTTMSANEEITEGRGMIFQANAIDQLLALTKVCP